MKRMLILGLLAGLTAAPDIAAQHRAGGGDHGRAVAPPQAQAGFGGREIKALPTGEMDDLRAGRGMGLALPAERNGYPGPMHVLEHADALGLSADQHREVTASFAAMRERAVAAGAAVIEAERALDRLFADRRATKAAVADATARAGAARAALRAVHLDAHLDTATLLTEAQIEIYVQRRGYRPAGPEGKADPPPASHR